MCLSTVPSNVAIENYFDLMAKTQEIKTKEKTQTLEKNSFFRHSQDLNKSVTCPKIKPDLEGVLLVLLRPL